MAPSARPGYGNNKHTILGTAPGLLDAYVLSACDVRVTSRHPGQPD